MGETRITISVTFLPTNSQGREMRAADAPSFMPHLVVGDPAQRTAIYDENNCSTEHYLGVEFQGSGDLFTPGEAKAAVVRLMYDAVDYSALAPGATFTVRMGGQVVGFGEVV